MSESTIPRFPLEWPAGWQRTPPGLRRRAAFHKIRGVQMGMDYVRKEKAGLDISDGLARLEGELRRLAAGAIVISSNLEVNAAGRPYTKQSKMLADPGVAVYFKLKAKPLVLACDKWLSTADNMAALAGHIEAIRAVDRYGVGTIEQAFAGYKALPADTAADWRQVFGLNGSATLEDVDTRFKALARERHPDRGGSDAAMSHLNRARDFARAELAG
jgi:hypothetical protein